MTETRKFDTILMIGLLEEIPLHPTKVLNKLKSNLNENGKIIIMVRNMLSLKRRIKNLFGLDPVDGFVGHIYIFTGKRLKDVCESCGYSTIKLTSNKLESFRTKTIPTTNKLSEESWIVIK